MIFFIKDRLFLLNFKGVWDGKALIQLAVKLLFGDSTGFDEIRWTIILPEKQISLICICLG